MDKASGISKWSAGLMLNTSSNLLLFAAYQISIVYITVINCWEMLFTNRPTIYDDDYIVLYVYRLLYDVLTMSCYIGALLALQRGYDVIVSYLLELTVRRLQADKSSHIPLSVSDVITEYRTWKDCLCNNRYTTHAKH